MDIFEDPLKAITVTPKPVSVKAEVGEVKVEKANIASKDVAQ